MINKSFEIYIPKIREILKKYKVKSGFLFGSVVSDKFDDNSDIDLVINFLDYSNPLEVGQSIWDIEDELEALTKRKIDLLVERALKNKYFIHELNNTKQLIYEHSTK